MWQKLIIQLITSIIFPLLDKAWDWMERQLEDYKNKKKAEQTSEEASKKMEEAKTAEEIDNATDDTLNGI